MANRRFEMYQYQQILSRMRLGDSDRDLARASLIGRKKAAIFRLVAEEHGWLDQRKRGRIYLFLLNLLAQQAIIKFLDIYSNLTFLATSIGYSTHF